jgi:hypothetical protein
MPLTDWADGNSNRSVQLNHARSVAALGAGHGQTAHSGAPPTPGCRHLEGRGGDGVASVTRVVAGVAAVELSGGAAAASEGAALSRTGTGIRRWDQLTAQMHREVHRVVDRDRAVTGSVADTCCASTSRRSPRPWRRWRAGPAADHPGGVDPHQGKWPNQSRAALTLMK